MTDEAVPFRVPVLGEDGTIPASTIPPDDVVVVHRRADGTPYINVREA
jgi:hypothetical protein